MEVGESDFKDGGVVEIMKQFDDKFRCSDWLIYLSPEFKKLERGLVEKSFLLTGPPLSGKTSAALWAAHHCPNLHLIVIECEVCLSDSHLLQRLATKIASALQIHFQYIDRAFTDSIKFSYFTASILASKKDFVLLFRDADKLVSSKKQLFLYSLLEWINNEVPSKVGLIFATKLLSFMDRMYKRVRSRLSAEVVRMGRPGWEVIQRLLCRRLYVYEDILKRSRGFKKDLIKIYLAAKIKKVFSSRTFYSLLKDQQQFLRDLPFYLNCTKYAVGCCSSAQKVLPIDDKQFSQYFTGWMMMGSELIFPQVEKQMLHSCTHPELTIMGIVYHLGQIERPIRLKHIYEAYMYYKQRLIHSNNVGSTFNYSHRIFYKTLGRLRQIFLLKFTNEEENLWNRYIISSMFPNDIKQGLLEIPNLPEFILRIID